MKTYGLMARSAAEAAGSFLLVLAGVGSTIFAAQGGVTPALAFGLALVAAVIAFGYVSGGHFNPALTLGAALAGRTSWKSVLPYFIAQVAGASLAALILWVLVIAHPQLGPNSQQFFSVAGNGFAELSQAQFPLASAFLAEFVAAALFVAVFLGATSRRAHKAAAPFAIGLTYAVLLTVLAPITNGSVNPARSTAVVYFAESAAAGQLWLFWAAPLLGAAVAGLVYRSVDFAGAPTAAAVTDADDAGTPGEAAGAASASAPEAPAHEAPAPGAAAHEAAAPKAAAHEAAAPQEPGRTEADDARDFFDGPGRK
jgi:aquaporin Z